MIIKAESASSAQLSLSSKVLRFVLRYGKYFLGLFLIISFLFFLILQTAIFNPTIVIKPQNNFFSKPVLVELKKIGSVGKAEIRYTTDGSDPTTQSELYIQPFKLEQTAVLKAALFNKGQLVSSVVMHDFFINTLHDLPIVSIVTDPPNLWNPEFGIYTKGNIQENDEPNYMRRGEDWQRPATFHFYETNKELVVNQKIGLRIHGGGSRNFPQRSLRLYADMENNQDTFNYQFFPDLEVNQFKSLILRNGGTDWKGAFIRDAVIQRVVQQKTELDFMPVRPVSVYLNGKYWGLYFLRDRFDTEYFYQRYGVDKTKISILEAPLRSGDKRGQVTAKDSEFDSDAELFNRLLKEAAVCRNCARYEIFNQYLDLENLIDFYIVQLHFNNVDWPYNNTEVWRYQNRMVMINPNLSTALPPGIDGRFRWMLFDVDQGIAPTKDTIEGVISSAKNTPYEQFVDDKFPWRTLFFNNRFLQNYLNRYANYLNTTFSEEAVITQIDRLVSEIETEMPRQIERWRDETDPDGNQFAQSYQDWMNEVELLKVFVQHRPDYMRQNSLDEFSYFTQGYGLINLQIESNNSEAGDIKIHKTTIRGDQLPFSGFYFPKTTLTIEALPQKGYDFIGWKGNVPNGQAKNQSLSLKLENDYQLEAIFEKRSFFWFNKKSKLD